ncbi:MAG: 30S ribosomal protein S9 [Patescibacteria group bacterium]
MERAIGRRKTACARVRITAGKGNLVINGRKLNDYFPIDIWQNKVISPLKIVGRDKSIDVEAKIAGGGIHAQAEALRHGIARALIKWDSALKPILKAEGFLTRDPRAKERKKAGLRKARRAHQWKKR